MASAAERKRAQRERDAASGTPRAPTAELIRKELLETFSAEVGRHCRGDRESEPTCAEIIDLISARYPIHQRGRVALYLGWPRHDPEDPGMMTRT